MLFEVVFHIFILSVGVMVFIFLFLHGIRLRTRLRRDKQPLADGCDKAGNKEFKEFREFREFAVDCTLSQAHIFALA